MQNSLSVGSNFWEEKSKTLVWKLKLNIMCFEKFLESFSCITCHEKSFENWFHRKISSFFKNSEFRSIECVFRSVENFMFSKHDLLPNSIDTRLILDQSKLENFLFLNYWPKFFFQASFMFRIHMHCIVFCIHFCSFAVISLIVFTYNLHTLC